MFDVVLPFTDSVSRVKISASWDARCQIPIPIFATVIRGRAARAGARLWSLDVTFFTVEFISVFGTFTINVQVPFWAAHNASFDLACAFQQRQTIVAGLFAFSVQHDKIFRARVDALTIG